MVRNFEFKCSYDYCDSIEYLLLIKELSPSIRTIKLRSAEVNTYCLRFPYLFFYVLTSIQGSFQSDLSVVASDKPFDGLDNTTVGSLLLPNIDEYFAVCLGDDWFGDVVNATNYKQIFDTKCNLFWNTIFTSASMYGTVKLMELLGHHTFNLYKIYKAAEKRQVLMLGKEKIPFTEVIGKRWDGMQFNLPGGQLMVVDNDENL